MAITHLILMRHAKSSWKYEDLADHQRPLNKRGKRAAKTIGKVLATKNISPNHIWSSDSERTRQTVKRAFGDIKADIIWLESFYHASANQVLLQCSELGEPTGILALIGHNPGWEDLLFYFSGRPIRMPTAACGVFKRKDFKQDWLSPDAWEMLDYFLPRDYE